MLQQTTSTIGSTQGKPSAGLLSATGASAFGALALMLFAAIALFYTQVYSLHTDLAGIVLSAQLAETLRGAFGDYSLYFPPAERAWFTLAVWLADLTGLRLDLAVLFLSGAALLFSVGLAFQIRARSVGASPVFLLVSLAVLVVLPVLYKNVFGLREHLVVLGLWPYVVLRISDPHGERIGWPTRLIVGTWMGAALTLKYLYAIAVLLVELVDAGIQRRPLFLFRVENLVSGALVAGYLFVWLILNPEEREAIGAVVSAIDANLASGWVNVEQAAIHAAVAGFFLLLGWLNKVPWRTSLIGLALVISAIAAAWIQSRWYSHHLFPITLAYMAWLWMIHARLKLLWIAAVLVLFVRPVAGEFGNSFHYQEAVRELDRAMAAGGVSVNGKRVGLLSMHPSPFNQHLAMNGGTRWIASMNNSYVASELKPLDTIENIGMSPGPVSVADPGAALLHDQMLSVWEDLPPDMLVLDHSTSWPLRALEVEWTSVFAGDARFERVLSGYREVYTYKGDEDAGERLDFTVYERVN